MNIDLLFFILIAGFFIYRLVQNLGQIEDEDIKLSAKHTKDVTNYGNKDDIFDEESVSNLFITKEIVVVSEATKSKNREVADVIEEINKQYDFFTEEYFCNSVKLIYQITKDAVDNDKIDELEKDKLCNKQVCKFLSTQKKRDSMVVVMKPEFINAKLGKTSATIQVALKVEEMLNTDNNSIINFSYIMEFSKKLSTKSANWMLTKMEENKL